VQGQLVDYLRKALVFDSAGCGRTGGERMLIVNDATEVVPLWLMEAAPARDPLPADFEVEPKPEDYVERQVRMLNQAVIGGWLDFTEPGVLEAAMGLAAPMNLVRDHSYQVEDFIGKVLSAEWGGPTAKIPYSGINGLCRFDKVVAPRIVRGLLSDPPTVERFSVAIEYSFRRSHAEQSDEWWYGHLGEDRNGELVRLIVVEVEQIFNLSTVWWGRDDYAMLLSRSGRASRGSVRGAPPPTTRTQEDEMVKNLAELAADNPSAKEELAALMAKAAAGDEFKKKAEEGEHFRTSELDAARDIALGLLEVLHENKVPKDDAEAGEITFAHENGRLDYLRKIGLRLKDRLDKDLPQHCPKCGAEVKVAELTRRQTTPSDPEGDRTQAPESKDKGRSRRSRELGRTLGGGK
jgi:hypothetical protein